MKTGLFITGTSTGVGKTVVSALLANAAMASNFPIRYFKPVQTGESTDCDAIRSLTDLDETSIISPLFAFQQPIAPIRAAALAGQTIDPQKIVDFWQQQHADVFIIEGIGGLMQPLQGKFSTRDLVAMLNISLLIVSSTVLGTINHTLLTVEAARSKGIAIKGIVLCGHPDPGLKEWLETLCDIPVVIELPWLSVPLTSPVLKKLASELVDPALLQRLFFNEN